MTVVSLLVLKAALFVMMVTIGLRTSPSDSLHLIRQWRLGTRAMLALFGLVPGIAIVLCYFAPIPPAVKLTLIALSVSPMLPTLPNDLGKLGVPHSYAISLEVLGGLVAMLVAPAVFLGVSTIMKIEVDLNEAALLMALTKSVFLPLGLGMALRFALPKLAERMAGPIIKLVSALLLGAAAVILALHYTLVAAQLSPAILIVIAVIVLAGLAVGHVLGGQDRATRGALALTAASRHIGFAIAAATAISPQHTPTIVGTAIVYFLVRRLLVIPYVRRMTPQT